MKSVPSLPTAALGVDVGSWNCCVAMVRGKVVDAVEDEYGKRKIPNFVLFDSFMRYIGSDAKANQDINFENTIFDFMQFLRKPFSKVSALSLQYPYKIVSDVGGNVNIAVEFGAKSYNLLPEQLLAMVLKKLKSVADDASGESVNNFVINVPQFYDEEQRAAIYDAAGIAEVNCLELLEDTNAVAINYAHSSRQVPERSDQFVTVAFVIVGYSCTQVAVCKMNKRRIVVCAHSSDPCLGGRDFDNVIYNHLAAYHPFLMEADAATRIRVLRECEEAKKRMGLHKKPVTITVDSLPGERSVNVKMDRSVFEKASEQLLKRFEDTLRKCKSNSMFDVEVVELIGGGVRIPAIKDSVQKVFGIAGQMTMNGDEALASGCALRAAAIQSPDDSSERKIVILKEAEEHKLSIDERVLKEYQTELKRLELGSRAHYHQEQQQQQRQRHQQPIKVQSNANDASGQLVSDFMERLRLVQDEAKSSLESLSGDSSGYLQTNEVLGHYLKFTQLLSELTANTPYSQISQVKILRL
ncbi:hypothetical protein CRM22_003004 [Opisthorchis felineus]|uniref:Uncharacterized protein n=1 Tax=Opisthorchis felineus TaxID=147828 RepID=A0A4S2M9L1_OPIFE|nr:hypothetical protein CRM22_003004 [Opisthorchis felineus]